MGFYSGAVMNAREKKIALMAYRLAIEHERKRADRADGNYMRKADSPEGMAITWATENEFTNGWWKIEDID